MIPSLSATYSKPATLEFSWINIELKSPEIPQGPPGPQGPQGETGPQGSAGEPSARAENINPDVFDSLDKVVSHFNNWDSVDRLCLHVMQPLLLKYPEETLRLLKKWNRSENMWKRRASVVAFVWKIGSSGEFTDEALDLCESLIWDKEDLVLKGVGWALRDNMNGAKKRVIEYVKSLRLRGVSSKVTLYAIQDLKDKERKEVLKIKPEKKGSNG